MENPSETLTTETALRALTRPERREILDQLATTSDGTTVQQLAAELAAMDPTAQTEDRDEIVTLHHVHLPLLRDAGIVEYDADQRTVQRGPQFEAVLSLLREVEDHVETFPRAQP